LTGGSAIGLNFSVGDLTSSNSSSLPSLDVLQTEFERILASLKDALCGERIAMGTVPEAYYQFIMDYAPNVYIIPPSTPDPAFGKGVLAASFAIDFLCEAYSAKQFEDRKADIYSKIVSLADWVLTQQCTTQQKRLMAASKAQRKAPTITVWTPAESFLLF
jgi:hypothetical protein